MQRGKIGACPSIPCYLRHRDGDVKKLKPPRTDFRLRCGDFRLFFDLAPNNAIHITAVKNRRDAYR